MITRVHFCEHCYASQRPKSGTYFMVHGSKSHKNWLHYLDHEVHRKNLGFTPHLFSVIKTEGDLVTIEYVCAIQGCGLEFTRNVKDGYDIVILRRNTTVMTVEEFKALYRFKDTGYKL